MPYQPTLPEPSGADLPSPLFTPRPGWGGKLAGWFRRNAYAVVFRVAVLAAAVFVVISLIRVPADETSLEPASLPADDALIQAAARGEGISHLAARALDAWLAAQEPVFPLDAVEHLYAVDRLTRIAAMVAARPGAVIYPGETARFPRTLVRNVVLEARALNRAEYSAWLRILPRK